MVIKDLDSSTCNTLLAKLDALAASRQAPPADDMDFPAEPETFPAHVCSCPCGCQGPVAEDWAKKGLEKYGVTRCPKCYPSATFDVAQHKGVGSLNLSKAPQVTAEMVAAELAKRGRAA